MDLYKIKMLGFDKLEQLCRAFHMPLANCTCEALKIGTSEGTRSFCGDMGDLAHSKEQKGYLVLPLLVTIIAIMGLLGNMTVIWVQTKKFICKTRHTVLISFLAMCDMFFAVFILVYYVPKFFTTHWVYGRIGCKIVGSAVTVGAWIAVGIILNIAIERFFGIVYPFRLGMTRNRMYVAMVINVCCAICFAIPRVMYLKIDLRTLDCHEEWVGNVIGRKVYDWSILVVYFITPVILISLLYFKMFLSIKESMSKCDIKARQHSDIACTERVRRNRKTITLLSAVLIAYILCTVPNKIRWLMLSFGISSVENPCFFIITEVVYSVHLSINPLIYAAADKKFRKTIKSRYQTLFGTTFHPSINDERRVTELFELHSFQARTKSLAKEKDNVG